MNAHRLGLLFSAFALAATGCIVTTTDDDDDGASSGTPGTTSGGSSAEESTAGDDESGDSSGTVVSGSSGEPPFDCSMCNPNVDPDPLCNSSFNPDTNQCECNPGFEFESDDPSDFTCVPAESTGDCGDDPNITTDANGNCVCAEGFEFCSADPADLTCCEAS